MTILAWQRGGSHRGTAVVLLHDWAADGPTQWQDTRWTAALEHAGLMAYVPDLPGHGESADVLIPPDTEPAAWTATAIANDLERLRVGTFFVVGHRVGAQVAGHIAVRQPQQAQRLVIIGCDDRALIPRAADVAAALRSTGSALWDPEASDAVARARRDRRHYLPTLAQWAEAAAWPAAPRLGALRTPVLLAVGRDGPRRERAPRLAALFHDGHLITAGGGADDLAAADLIDGVVGFLTQHEL